MASYSGPALVTNGLILDLDIENRKSNMRAISTSLIDTTAWASGQTGGVGTFSANETVNTENARVTDTDPWGNTSVVWETRASGDGNNDGGWNTGAAAIDRTKLYRFSVWVRRTSSTSGGTFYFGTGSDGGVFSVQDNGEKGNPYWDCRGVGNFTQNQWYLFVGHIFPAATTSTGNHPDTGFYLAGNSVKAGGVNFCNIVSDLKWGTSSTWGQHRCYHFYCGDNTTRLQFADPRIDLCDGSEPSIYELVNNGATLLMDNSSYKNHHRLNNGYAPIANSPKRLQLNGTDQGIVRTSALSGVSNNCTVVIWYKTTDGQELWVRGSQSNSVYLSASSGGNYYHGNAGSSPVNYVDTVQVVNPTAYRNGAYHMWEAKGVDFSGWTYFEWFLYPGGWQMTGDVAKIMVYNRVLTESESIRNFQALRGRFGI